MNQPWSDLPNAHHIDWVLASVNDNPALWVAESPRGPVRSEARDSAWAAAYDAAFDAAWEDAARDAAWVAARAAAGQAVTSAAWGAALALIAYDDCDQYLTMNYEELIIWAALSEHPAAVLLQPMIYVREQLHDSTKLDSLKKHIKL